MVSRRRLLLSYLANSFKYLPYSYEYLYYGLVPTTIDGKQVRNKAKVSMLYGNSVVENQLLQPLKPTETQNGITITNNGDGSYTLTGTATATTYFVFLYGTWTDHYYLFKGINYPNNNVRWYDIYYGIYSSNKDFIFRNTNSSYTQLRASIRIESGTDFTNSPFTFFPNLIDLTQKYPFDTPTTLTDNRVQAILNRGYIPYNLGELKSVDIGEISSEPFNIWNEEWELGNISGTDGANVVADNRIRSKDFTKVIPNKTYYCRTDTSNALYIRCYDENFNFVSQTITGIDRIDNRTFTIPQIGVSYIKLVFLTGYGTTYKNDTCINVSSSLNGTYKPHTQPQTIPFKYQGSGVGTAHDTYELTKTAHVFTKNMSRVDLGTFNYVSGNASNPHCFQASGFSGCASFTSSQKANILCGKYLTDTGNNVYAGTNDKTISYTSVLRINDTQYDVSTDLSTFKTSMSGVMLEYQLATPQVISIPRKHLGIVDLGSLNWHDFDANNRTYTTSDIPNIAQKENNAIFFYCNKYVSTSLGTSNAMSWYNNRIFVADMSLSGKTGAEIKQIMSGTLLFYETENEVADITDTFDIQSGGTINTDSNVLPNADFLMKCK